MNAEIPKIAEAIGLIDDKYIEFALDYKPRKMFVRRRILPLAACLAVTAGVGLFAVFGRDLKFSRKPENTVSTEESVYGGMPEPSAGEASEEFFATVNPKLGYLDAAFCEIAGWEETAGWLEEYSPEKSDLTAVDEAANLYSFIRRFEIPDETVREVLSERRSGSGEDFSDEEIELILSDDAEAVAGHFAAETAIVKGKNLYSPKWLYVHSAEDYAGAGINSDDLEKVYSELDGFDLTDEAREAFEKKLSETMTYTGGVLVYNDETVVYNSGRPLYMKDFTIVDEFYDENADGFIFYLAPNDRSDENIYACFYMYDQLIAAACDGPKSFPAYEAVFRFTDYYTEKQPAPVGAVVRLAWDGLADNEYEILRLPMLSRIQFKDADTPYTEGELSSLRASLEGRYLDSSELVDEMWTSYRLPGDENTVEVSGILPYRMAPESTVLEDFRKELDKKAEIKYPDSVMTYLDGELYAETGYTLTEEEFAKFMFCAVPQPSAFRAMLPEGVEADYSAVMNTPEFVTGNFTLTDAPLNGGLQSNCFVRARLWQLIGGEFIFARLDEDVELSDGGVLHGWLFRRAEPDENGPMEADGAGDYPEELEFLNRLSEYYDGDYVWRNGERYRYNRIILTKKNCEDFIAAAEYIGESRRDPDVEGELCTNILESGARLYAYRSFILAVPEEPEPAGLEFDGEKAAKVYIYGYLYEKG